MTINYPTSLDSLTNPTSTDSLSSPDHATQHSDINDAVEALQAKVGVNSSSVATSLDYRVAQLESSKVAQTIETKTGAYTIVAGDAGKIILMNATANFTVNGSTDFSVGQRVDVIRIAAGACDVVQGSGATVVGTPGLKLRAQYSAATILCVGTDSYYVIGDLSA